MALTLSQEGPKLLPFPSAEAASQNDPPYDPLSDDGMMRQVQAGRMEALAMLFERHHTALLNFYLKTIGNRAASEDLVQDVFVRILKYKHSYRPGSRFVTWMYYIARNARLDHLHKSRGEIEWDDAYATAVQPGDAVQAAQERRLLRAAMGRLPDEKREILVLSRFQGMKYDEIASILGVEVGTVKVRVHRAVRELRGHYQHLCEGGAAL